MNKLKSDLIARQLSENEFQKRLANYFLSTEISSKLTATKVSEDNFISNSLVTKFAKSFGFNTFNEFKNELIRINELESTTKKKYLKYSIDTYISDLTKSLDETSCLINEDQIQQLANKLKVCKKIVLFAIGGSKIVAQDLELKLLKLGFNVFLCIDIHLVKVMANLLEEGDIAIGISYSGSYEVIQFLHNAKDKGGETVLISNIIDTYVDYNLEVIANESPIRRFSIGSRSVMLLITDLIILSLINTDYDHYIDILNNDLYR